MSFDRSSGSICWERKNLAEQPVAGRREGSELKKKMLKASRTVIAPTKKTDGWKAGEGGPRERESYSQYPNAQMLKSQSTFKKFHKHPDVTKKLTPASPSIIIELSRKYLPESLPTRSVE